MLPPTAAPIAASTSAGGVSEHAALLYSGGAAMFRHRTGSACREFPLDPGIKVYVETLAAAGIETFESCQGGEGHSMPEPTVVRFHGERGEGVRALAVALQGDLPVADLRRYWSVIDGEPTGPYWELTFRQRRLQ